MLSTTHPTGLTSPLLAKQSWLRLIIVLFNLCLSSSLQAAENERGTIAPVSPSQSIITFGSCLRQWQPQPVWQTINRLQPDAFIFLGDNMYADVGDYLKRPEPQRIADAYHDLAASTEFQSFLTTSQQNNTQLFATWDDHDYGINDGGADYHHKLASKQHFLDFFKLTETVSGDASQPGIYQSYRLQLQDLDTQLILLDTRSFRSPLKKDPEAKCSRTKTVANDDPEATVLGEQQWQWLEQQLRQTADLRIIASSIQVISEQHCFEKWANFPRERQRLFQLIKETKANGVVLISGDRHLAEIAELPPSVVGYPLYEITASGLNSAMGWSKLFSKEENHYRLADSVYDDNFGAISLRKHHNEYIIALQIYTTKGDIAREQTVALSQLTTN